MKQNTKYTIIINFQLHQEHILLTNEAHSHISYMNNHKMKNIGIYN